MSELDSERIKSTRKLPSLVTFLMITKKELQEQIEFASNIVKDWPIWKQNILNHSLEPTNKIPRPIILGKTK